MKNIYLLLAIIGAAIPLYELVQFLLEHGFDFLLFIRYLFANRISTFFAYDLIISIIVFIIYMIHQSKKQKIKLVWIPIVSSFFIGLSFSLPIYLFLIELQKKQTNP